MKIYFAHYEFVSSMNLDDAIKLCNVAVRGEGYEINYETCPSLKQLKKKNRKENGYMGRNKVNHCLDWSIYEWRELLDELENIRK